MKFLILDDEVFIIKMLNLTISKYFPNCEILSSTNPYEALETVTSGKFVPDILLIDYLMPQLDGLKVSQQIREYCKSRDVFSYIIMFSGNQHKELEVACMQSVDDFVLKPLDIDILVSRIKVGERIFELFQEKNRVLTRNKQIFSHLSELSKINQKLIVRLSDVIEKLAISLSEAIEYKDFFSRTHVLKVGQLSELMAKELELEKETLQIAKYTGYFHDIGKIAIPDEILQKPFKLTEEEFNKVKEHTEIGAEIIKPIAFFKGLVEGVRFHHERWDGLGYPKGLKKEEIPLVSRIVSVVDVFDVILSARPYKKARSMQEAYTEILKNKGTQFDPDIVDVFEKLYHEKIIEELYAKIEKENVNLMEKIIPAN